MTKHTLAAVLTAAITTFAAIPASAGNQLAVAISGYDPVSYHQDAPVEGEAAIRHFWNGAVWFFSNEENREVFAANPETFAPAFDGFCAYAASQGYKAPGDPQIFEVVEGVLYLQVSERAQELWSADIPTHIAAGNENWARIHPF